MPGTRPVGLTALGRANLRMRWFYEVTHLSTSLGLVEAGLGVSVLPRLATPQGEHPIIVTRPIIPRVTRPLAPAAQRFRELLIETWADKVAADGVAADEVLAEP